MKTGKNRVFLKKVEFFLFLISEFQIWLKDVDNQQYSSLVYSGRHRGARRYRGHKEKIEQEEDCNAKRLNEERIRKSPPSFSF